MALGCPKAAANNGKMLATKIPALRHANHSTGPNEVPRIKACAGNYALATTRWRMPGYGRRSSVFV